MTQSTIARIALAALAAASLAACSKAPANNTTDTGNGTVSAAPGNEANAAPSDTPVLVNNAPTDATNGNPQVSGAAATNAPARK